MTFTESIVFVIFALIAFACLGEIALMQARGDKQAGPAIKGAT